MANLIEFLATWWWLPVLLTLLWPTYFGAIRVKRRRVEQRWLDDFRAGRRLGAYEISHGMRIYTSPYGTKQRMVNDRDATSVEKVDESYLLASEPWLLGLVSAWVAEGEARAVREWEAQYPLEVTKSQDKMMQRLADGGHLS